MAKQAAGPIITSFVEYATVRLSKDAGGVFLRAMGAGDERVDSSKVSTKEASQRRTSTSAPKLSKSVILSK